MDIICEKVESIISRTWHSNHLRFGKINNLVEYFSEMSMYLIISLEISKNQKLEVRIVPKDNLITYRVTGRLNQNILYTPRIRISTKWILSVIRRIERRIEGEILLKC